MRSTGVTVEHVQSSEDPVRLDNLGWLKILCGPNGGTIEGAQRNCLYGVLSGLPNVDGTLAITIDAADDTPSGLGRCVGNPRPTPCVDVQCSGTSPVLEVSTVAKGTTSARVVPRIANLEHAVPVVGCSPLTYRSGGNVAILVGLGAIRHLPAGRIREAFRYPWVVASP